mmetsp:Transcript_8604/g.28689  ORF Transcript_8604/g.28689 Transcript_8604/m.28689 type:complete len:87 (+) Transcript_8604:7468-7728(+)
MKDQSLEEMLKVMLAMSKNFGAPASGYGPANLAQEGVEKRNGCCHLEASMKEDTENARIVQMWELWEIQTRNLPSSLYNRRVGTQR